MSRSIVFFNTSNDFCISFKVASCFTESALALSNSLSNLLIVLCASVNSCPCFTTKVCASVNGMLDALIKFKAFSLLLLSSFHCVNGTVIVGSAWLVEDISCAKQGEKHNATDKNIAVTSAIK